MQFIYQNYHVGLITIHKLRFNDFYNKKVNYEGRFALHEFVIKEEIQNQSIDYLEFGVASGIAIKWWAEKNINPESRFYGFDVFTGLPEDFGVMKKHHYDTEGNIPKLMMSVLNLLKVCSRILFRIF